MGAFLLLGMVLRLHLIQDALRSIDADQAITGIMAMHILRGQASPVFYYGLYYQGPLDAYLAAPLFALFGPHSWVLRLVPLVCSLGLVVATYFVGKVYFSQRVGLYSACYIAVPPFMLNVWGLNANADYIMVTLTGSLSLLLYHSYRQKPSGRKTAALFLLFLFGTWLHPVMLYYVAAIGIVWLVGSTRFLRTGRSGAETRRRWLIVTALVSFAILMVVLLRQDSFFQQAIWYVGFFTAITLPILLGLQTPFPWRMYPAAPLASLPVSWTDLAGLVLVFAILLVVLWKAIRLVGRGKAMLPVLAFTILLMHTAVAAAVPIKLDSLTQPRYLLPFYSTVPLGTAAFFAVTRRALWMRPILFAGLVIIHLIGNLSPKPQGEPDALLAWLLQRDGTQYVYADYWVGYWLAFESGERVIPASLGVDNQPGHNRYPPYAARVAAASDPLFIFYRGEDRESLFRNYLLQTGATFQLSRVGDFVVYEVPSAPLHIPLPSSRE